VEYLEKATDAKVLFESLTGTTIPDDQLKPAVMAWLCGRNADRHWGFTASGMRHRFPAALGLGLILAMLVATLPVAKMAAAQPQATASAAAIAEYRRALAQYTTAHDAYAAAAQAYWSSIAEKRKARFAKRVRHEPFLVDDYVLTQPPRYTGPAKPVDPSRQNEEPPPPPVLVPVVADLLAASMREFKFAPRQPQSEIEFKRAYAQAAAAAGLTKDQVVRIYGFEATGNGTYDTQAGLEYKNPDARAVTTALGYNQLLATNSVELIAESGDKFVARLAVQAKGLPAPQQAALKNTIAVLRQMIAFARSVPDDWAQHGILAKTPKGLAIHAMNLDRDVGPLLQTQKLLESVKYARNKGYGATLSAAELEMMNLTGDGNGFDMITMPLDWRNQVPTANFFQPGGYNTNPVAQRNNLVATLMAVTNAEMDREIKKPGAVELALVFPE
jgi:hypothetical protein